MAIFKVGDVYRINKNMSVCGTVGNFNTSYAIKITRIDSDSQLVYDILDSNLDKLGNCCFCYSMSGRGLLLESINNQTTMQNEEIPVTLSVMERITADADTKTLIKAGYMKDGNLTKKATDMISVLQFQAFKAQMVTAANEELTEAKE